MTETDIASPLFGAQMTLFKAASASDAPDANPKFGGVASSEDTDVDGDAILRKALDISYISKRGYVNWDLVEPERPCPPSPAVRSTTPFGAYLSPSPVPA